MFAGDLTAEAVHVVVVPLNLDHVGPVDEISKNLGGFQVVRNEYIALHLGCGCMRGYRVRQVAGRGAGHRVVPEFQGAGNGDRHDAVLEGEGRMIHRVILNVQRVQAEFIAEVLGANERGQAGIKARGRLSFDRQEIQVAPEALGTGLDAPARNVLPDLRIVVLDLQRAEAQFADVQRDGGVFFPAFPADQPFHFMGCHGLTAQTSASCSIN